MEISFYQKIRGTLKHLYFALRKIVPAPVFLALSFRIMYYANKFAVMSFISKYKFSLLENLDLSFKKSDTLFILGSGSSINEYSKSQWEEIAEGNSVGFNFWLLHDFIPSFYVYEENLDEKRNNIFYEILESKKDLYAKVPFIVKDIEYKGLSVGKIPAELKEQIYLSIDLTVGASEEELDLFFMKGNQFITRKNKNGLNVILKKSGTLSYLIFLAQQMNYKKIVLCGIDLNNSNYFYDKPEYDERYPTPSNYANKEGVHPTNLNIEGNIPMEKIIAVIDEQILKPQGIELFVGSKKSALYPIVPYYFENEAQKDCD